MKASPAFTSELSPLPDSERHACAQARFLREIPFVKTISSTLPPEVAELETCVTALLPDALISTEPGGVTAGNWWIEVRFRSRIVTAEWRPACGFGLYPPEAQSYGEGPVEIFQDASIAARHLRQLLFSYS